MLLSFTKSVLTLARYIYIYIMRLSTSSKARKRTLLKLSSFSLSQTENVAPPSFIGRVVTKWGSKTPKLQNSFGPPVPLLSLPLGALLGAWRVRLQNWNLPGRWTLHGADVHDEFDQPWHRGGRTWEDWWTWNSLDHSMWISTRVRSTTIFSNHVVSSADFFWHKRLVLTSIQLKACLVVILSLHVGGSTILCRFKDLPKPNRIRLQYGRAACCQSSRSWRHSRSSRAVQWGFGGSKSGAPRQPWPSVRGCTWVSVLSLPEFPTRSREFSRTGADSQLALYRNWYSLQIALCFCTKGWVSPPFWVLAKKT